jgi:hypothetical protein
MAVKLHTLYMVSFKKGEIMKNFNEWMEEMIKNQPNNVKWVMPNIQKEMDELERTADTLGIDLNSLIRTTQQSKLVPLDEMTWRSMKNTDSYGIKKGDMRTVNSLGGGYGRDVGSILDAFQQGGTLPAPIVLVQNNEPYLVAGNTRLMVARAMGVQPMILKVVLT